MKTFAAQLESALVATMNELLETRDLETTIKHLHALADRPGTPEEGKTARAKAFELSKKRSGPTSNPDDDELGQHPLHDVATKFGYKTTVTNHYKHPTTGHHLHLYDKQYDPADKDRHFWQHSHPRGASFTQYNPNIDKLRSSLVDHLKSVHEPEKQKTYGAYRR